MSGIEPSSVFSDLLKQGEGILAYNSTDVFHLRITDDTLLFTHLMQISDGHISSTVSMNQSISTISGTYCSTRYGLNYERKGSFAKTYPHIRYIRGTFGN